MNVQNKVKQDMVSAMKNKESEKLLILRVVIGEFARFGKDVDDEKAIKIISKMYDNAKQIANASEMKILHEYLPKKYSEEQVRALVANIVEAHGYKTMKDLGGVMSTISNNPNALLIDKKYASAYAKELLS